MLEFYTSYVRPVLKNGRAVWSHTSSYDINLLPNLQRYFTNKLPGCAYLPYSQRLLIRSLNSLQHGRVVCDLSTLHSLIYSHLCLSLSPHNNHTPLPVISGHNLQINILLLSYASSTQNLISRTAHH